MIHVIMPMYNEKNIRRNILETIKSLGGLKYKIIVVDDGSKIDCISEARGVKDKRVKIVGYKQNMGKGYALKYGFKFIKAKDDDLVAFLDSDLELHPRQIKNIVKFDKNKKEILPEEADVVIGSKKHPLSMVYYPLFRRFMSRVYQAIIKILFDLKVRDTQVGLKIFRYRVLKEVFPKILVKRFAFDLELLVNINKLGYKIVEVPIKLDYKFESRINPKSVFYIWLDTAAIFYRLKILRYYG